MKILNRAAVVVTPGRPFLDWLHQVDSTSAAVTMDDVTQDPSIYLLPEGDSDQEMDDLVRDSSARILADQFAGWYNDAEVWPSPLDYQLLRQWFSCSVHSMIFDTCDGKPLRRSDA